MNPWEIIGWLVLALVFGIPLTAFVVSMTVAILKDGKENRLRKRADAGKVTCSSTGAGPVVRCDKVATHRTTTGFYCLEHVRAREARGHGSFSVTVPLQHYVDARRES